MKNKTFKRIHDIAKPFIASMIAITVISIVIDVCEILKPYIVKLVIDDFLTNKTYGEGLYTLTNMVIAYGIIVIFSEILTFMQRIMATKLGEQVTFNLRNKLFRHVQKAKVSFHDKTPAGKLFVRITNDVEDIANMFKEVIVIAVKDIFMLISIVVIMLVLSFKLSLLAFIIIPFMIAFAYIISKTLRKLYEFSKNINTRLNVFFAETIYGLKLIKIFNRQKEKQQEGENLTKNFYNSRKKIIAIDSIIFPVVDILENIAVSIIVVASVNGIWGIKLEVGLIYLFITYIKRFFEPIMDIMEKIEVVGEAITSINKIYDILEDEKIEDLEKGITLENVVGTIEFKNVWFAYVEQNWVLKDVSFKINPKENVALVGKTGSR